VKRFVKVFFKTFLITVLIAVLAFSGIVAGYILSFIATSTEINVDNLRMNLSSIVYYQNEEGEYKELEKLYDDQNRVWVDIEKIPKYMKDAFISIEDERFEKHKGFDIKRIIGAVLNYIKLRRPSYGASTITQQLVKNITGDDEVTLRRKIQEIYRAYKLEKQLTKDEILELYLNTIYLGQQCNGVQSAANTYFGKNVWELSLAECASIAGITQYPSKYDPFINPKNNKDRQLVILKKMLELNKISQEEYEKAKNEELVFKKQKEDKVISKYSYFVDTVIEDVIKDLQEQKGYSKTIATKMLYSGGLQIYTTIDPKVQAVMDEVYKNDENFPKTKGDKVLQSAMIVIDPYTGHIKGIVGGRGEKTASRTLNRATQTTRQPGSAIKPIAVYAPALEYGLITPATTVEDAPITIGNWTPKNSYSGYKGWVSVRDAVIQSMNIPAVKVLDELTVDTSYTFLTKNLGITTLVEKDVRANNKVLTDKNLASLALGGLTDGLTVKELTAAYIPFVNKGLYLKPVTYTKVTDKDGKIILENKIDAKVAMSESTAYLMTSMLSDVVTSGTGTSAYFKGVPIAGKTGTTSDNYDRWFVGYTPYYVGGVWFGYDTPSSISGISGNPAASIWKKVMEKIHEGKSGKSFNQPSGIIKAEVCRDSGLLAGDLCASDRRGSRVKTEVFKRGTAPNKRCDIHQEVTVCLDSGKIANDTCVNTQKEVRAVREDTPVCDIVHENPVPQIDLDNTKIENTNQNGATNGSAGQQNTTSATQTNGQAGQRSADEPAKPQNQNTTRDTQNQTKNNSIIVEEN